MNQPDPLVAIIRQMADHPVYPAIEALVDHIRRRIANPAAILFYGSCLRSGDDRGGMADLYVLVDRYQNSGQSAIWSALNRLLPPNVFYLEVPFENRRIRAKYAILSLRDFERGTSMHWFHSYLWGRFAQPVAIAFAREPEIHDRITQALAQSVTTFAQRVLPCTKSPFTASDLWFKGLSLSYRAELRAERPEKLSKLVAMFDTYYETLTRAVIPHLPDTIATADDGSQWVYTPHIAKGRRFRARQIWRLRFAQGKMLSVLRLIKGAFTFSGGIDYIQWKIERHTGVRITLPPHLARFPIIAVGVLAWRTYRRGGFR
jgi:hypothetical protein